MYLSYVEETCDNKPTFFILFLSNTFPMQTQEVQPDKVFMALWPVWKRLNANSVQVE